MTYTETHTQTGICVFNPYFYKRNETTFLSIEDNIRVSRQWVYFNFQQREGKEGDYCIYSKVHLLSTVLLPLFILYHKGYKRKPNLNMYVKY